MSIIIIATMQTLIISLYIHAIINSYLLTLSSSLYSYIHAGLVKLHVLSFGKTTACMGHAVCITMLPKSAIKDVNLSTLLVVDLPAVLVATM